jgi:hypothetical protein
MNKDPEQQQSSAAVHPEHDSELADEQLDAASGGTTGLIPQTQKISGSVVQPDEAATMTAIALAESGGNTRG